MLEKMDEFFDRRIDGYDEHMLKNIESARAFYPYTAEQLPRHKGASVLDLGCGTGLELTYYFDLNPTARVTGIDLAEGMLSRCAARFSEADFTPILGSYFDLPLGDGIYDAAVSVESLHHFTQQEKIQLYTKLRRAIRQGGYFVLTDYFSVTDEEEHAHRAELDRLRRESGISDSELCHFDTPLTVIHECEALLIAGFSRVEERAGWGATHCIVAYV